MHEPSRTSIPNTPFLTVKYPQYLEMRQGQLRAHNQENIPKVTVPENDEHLVQVIFEEKSVIRIETQNKGKKKMVPNKSPNKEKNVHVREEMTYPVVERKCVP